METTKNKLSEKVQLFFKELSDYLELKIIFFGSVQRADYMPGHSDIDVDLFTENLSSTLYKMQSYFHVSKKKFKKFIWKLQNGRVAYGYKYMYKRPKEKFAVEFSIYDEKFKEDVLQEHRRKMVVPFYISWLLLVLKFFYYQLGWMDKKTFKKYKSFILSWMIGLDDDLFVVLDDNPDETTKKIYNLVVHGKRN